eukprot:m51a1_g10616 hypothetical protein (68) ;mRNA; f:51049-51252
MLSVDWSNVALGVMGVYIVYSILTKDEIAQVVRISRRGFPVNYCDCAVTEAVYPAYSNVGPYAVRNV